MQPATPSNSGGAARLRAVPWLPVTLLLCILPLCFLGYGTDNDTYTVLDCGYSTWHLHAPCTSRHPGYWLYEAIVFALNRFGGSALTNLGSFAMAALVVWRFWKWAARLGVRYPSLMTAALISTPAFVIASSSTDDYLWSLLFLVLGGEMIVANRLVAAALLSAVAMAIRGANGPVVAGGFAAAIVYEIWTQRRVSARSLKLAASGLASAIIAAAAFYPSYRLAGNNLSFMVSSADLPQLYHGWLRLEKFLYKVHETVGPIAVVVIAIAVVRYRRDRRPTEHGLETGKQLGVLCVGYALGNIALFLRYPIEFFYLIPATFFLMLLGGITLFARSRRLTIALFLSILSSEFLLPVFAVPNVPGRSTGASLHPGLKPGFAIQDTAERIRYIGCHDDPCFDQRWHEIHGR